MTKSKVNYRDVGSGSAEGEAYNYLLNRIRSGDLTPGTRLKAEDIAVELGLSRMPVREAFLRLDAQGLVTVRPNRGAVVTGFTADQIQELFEIRSVLEGLAMRLAVQNVSGLHVEELRDLLFRMDRSRNDDNEWVKRHWQFHEYLCGISGRPRLLQEIEKFHTVLEPSLRVWLDRAEKPTSALQEHQRLIDVLVAGDADKAESMMRDHVLNTVPSITRIFRSQEQARDVDTGAANP